MYKLNLLLICLPFIFCYKLEEGREFDTSRYSQQGEKGENGYIGQHQTTTGAKGHHDRADHQKQYAERAGHKNGFNHNDGYFSDFHQGEKGRKGFHYADNGRYAKGHRTKGHHNIHKLNEYKKNTDFYDEDNDQAFEEKHGGYESNKAVSKGNQHKGGFLKKDFLEGKFGSNGFSDQGSSFYKNQGFDNSQGQDAHYANEAINAKKNKQEELKHFGFANFNKY